MSRILGKIKQHNYSLKSVYFDLILTSHFLFTTEVILLIPEIVKFALVVNKHNLLHKDLEIKCVWLPISNSALHTWCYPRESITSVLVVDNYVWFWFRLEYWTSALCSPWTIRLVVKKSTIVAMTRAIWIWPVNK